MTEDKSTLTDRQIEQALQGLEGWERDGVFLRKDFRFDTWKEVNQFLPHFGRTIAEQNHHPDFQFFGSERRLYVEVTTHSEGCLTQADLDLARALNAWRRQG